MHDGPLSPVIFAGLSFNFALLGLGLFQAQSRCLHFAVSMAPNIDIDE